MVMMSIFQSVDSCGTEWCSDLLLIESETSSARKCPPADTKSCLCKIER